MSYNADELESKIDGCRLHRNWGAVVKYIEKYAHVFAVGVGQHSKQHADIKGVRAYYWTVMAEILLEKKRDYLKSFGCIKKASEIQCDYFDWKIILVRVLLDQIMPNNKAANSTHVSPRPVVIGEKDLFEDSTSTGDTISMCDNLSIADPTEYDPVVMLEDVFHTLSSFEKKLLLSILSNTSGVQRNALLAAMNILPHDAGVIICTELLRYSQTLSSGNSGNSGSGNSASSPAFLSDLLYRWVLLVCDQIMSPITAQDALTKFFAGSLSEYRLWLVIDSVYCRSVVCELLGDKSASRNILINMLRNIMSTPQLNEKSIQKVPSSVMNLCTLASCRLPLLEYQSGLKDEAVASLRRLINPDFALKPFVPITTYAGILVECALITLSKLAERGPETTAPRAQSPAPIDGQSPLQTGRYQWTPEFAAAYEQLEEARHLITYATSYKCAYLNSSNKYKSMNSDPSGRAGVGIKGNPQVAASGHRQGHGHGAGSSVKDGFTVFPVPSRENNNSNSSTSSSAHPPTRYHFLTMSAIAPEALSVLYRLPNVLSNPGTLAESGSSVLIGSILAALKVQFYPLLGNDIAEPLEWGIAGDTEPPVHALWNLASAYMRCHKYTPVVNLCEQCHDRLDVCLSSPNAAACGTDSGAFGSSNSDSSSTIRSTSSGSLAVTVDRQSTTLVSDVLIGTVIRSLWEEYTETVLMHAPMSRMVHILVDVYEDYGSAQAHVYRGLMNVFSPTRYPNVGGSGLAHTLIQMMDKPHDDGLAAAATAAVQSIKTVSIGRADCATLASYLYLCGVVYASWGRDSHYCSNHHYPGKYIRAAVRCFQLLYKGKRIDGKDDGEEVEEEMTVGDNCSVRNVALQYIVVLAESGEIEQATTVAREQISKHPQHIQFKHILSLLLASGECTDSNGNINTALALCKAALGHTRAYAHPSSEDTLDSPAAGSDIDSDALCISYYDLMRHLNIQLSRAFLKTANGIPDKNQRIAQVQNMEQANSSYQDMPAGSSSSNSDGTSGDGPISVPAAASTADTLGSVIRSLKQIDHVATTYCVPFVLRMTNAPDASDTADATSEGTPVTLTIPHAALSDVRLHPVVTAGHSRDPTATRHAPVQPSVGKRACVVDFTCSYFGPNDDCSTLAGTASSLYASTTAAGSLRRDKRVLVLLLIDVIKLFLQLQCYVAAKETLEKVWRLLYSNTADVHVSMDTYSNDYQHVRNSMHRSGYLHSSSLSNSSVTTELLSSFNEFERLEYLRHVPTLFGWRIANGTGHNLSTSSDGNSYCTDLEAEVIYLCNQAIYLSHSSGGESRPENSPEHDSAQQAQEQLQRQQKRMHVLNQCRELCSVALSIHPNHVPSMLAIAELSLEEVLLCPASSSTTGTITSSVLKYGGVVFNGQCGGGENASIVTDRGTGVEVDTGMPLPATAFHPHVNRTVVMSKIDMYLKHALDVVSRHNNTHGVSTHPDAFNAYYILGQVEEINGCADLALDSYVQAMQCQQYSTRRSFCNSLV